jgi:hypothetical protein
MLLWLVLTCFHQFALAEDADRVRIGFKLVPFVHTSAGTNRGAVVKQTLRARLKEPNHFFIGDWHIATVPISLVKETGRYQVQLQIFRRYGTFGQLEERLGDINVTGSLTLGTDNVFVINGAARKAFKDKFGRVVAEVVAGNGTIARPTVAQGQKPKGVPVPSKATAVPQNQRARF